MDDRPVRRSPRPIAHWLLVLPFLGTLWPALYARAEPSVAGIPFFYWYQFAWIALTALIVGTVYVLTRDRRA